jgi:hypothetical protein
MEQTTEPDEGLTDAAAESPRPARQPGTCRELR